MMRGRARLRRRLAGLFAALTLIVVLTFTWSFSRAGGDQREHDLAAFPEGDHDGTTGVAVQVTAPVAAGDKAPNTSATGPQRHLSTTLSGESGAERKAFEPVVKGYAISVEGRDVVVVLDLETAEQVIHDIQEEYKESVLRGATTIQRVQVIESLAFQESMTLASLLRSREEAKNILRRGTDKLIYYTVQRGDTLWEIARSHELDVDDLQKANPEIRPESLQIGQQINMVIAEPYVHLESVVEETYTVATAFTEEVTEDPSLWPWQYRIIEAGEYGQRQITERLTRRDGEIISREILENRELKRPKTQRSVKGSKIAPKLGTGELHWPLNGGYLTSGYGWRWGRMHPGIDIAAPRGTEIYAADGGTVVYAGWRGDYGNAILVDHGAGKMVTLYGHLSSFSVRLGDEVRKGAVIGYVGSTGWSTGPHLHFEVWIDDMHTNPLIYYP